jgi:ABC-2 type transport system permease protein
MTTFPVTVGGLALGYRAIAGERDSGAIRLTAGGLSRSDVFLGKLLGRWLMLLAVTAVPTAVLLGLGSVWYGPPDTVKTAQFLLATVLYTLCSVGVGVGISAAVQRSTTAAGVALSYFLVTLFWESVAVSVYAFLTGTRPNPFEGVSDPAFYLFEGLDLSSAYMAVTNGVLDVRNSWNLATITLRDSRPNTEAAIFVVDDALAGSPPFYLEPWFGIVLMALWASVALAIGYRRFSRSDL